ncbi:MAG: hypothetical protein V3V18_13315 [Methylococcales bacterium]
MKKIHINNESTAIRTGYIDEITPHIIRGWACDGHTDIPVEVSLYINDEFIEKTRAFHYRKGLLLKGIHSTGNCEFRFDTKKHRAKFKGNDKIRITIEKLKLELNNSPIIVQEKLDFSDHEKFFYMHIAKTGGTTFNDFISSNLTNSEVRTHLEANRVWDNTTIQNIRNLKFISGHLRIKDLNRLIDLRGHVKMTTFREPFSQLISHLSWLLSISNDISSGFYKNHPDFIQKLSLKLRNIDLEDINSLVYFIDNMDKYENILFNNCQTRYLISNHAKIILNDKDLEEAYTTLNMFDHIGFLENIDQFIKIISLQYNLKTPDINEKQLNKNSNKLAIDYNNTVIRGILHPLVKYDLLIYKKAKELTNLN